MDGRLEKIRRFEGSVMDFDSYVKDRIEQTKKENTCTSQTDKAKRKKRVDEKLNIQPVSKERLNSRILETDGWKSKLKTGDFITITTKTKDTIGNILKKANSYIFVSLNDYQDYYEGDILDIGESAEKECGGGILVTSDRFDNLIYTVGKIRGRQNVFDFDTTQYRKGTNDNKDIENPESETAA